jgi:WD40 repeat protein
MRWKGGWVVGQADGKLRVCDIRGNELFARNEHTAWITAIAVSANGETVATTSSDRTLCLWDASTLESKARLRGHVGEVWSLDISADGRMVVSGSVDGMTKLWEATSHAVPSVVKGLLLNFTDDGRTLILGSSEEMTQWDVTRGAAKSGWPSSAFGDAAILNYSQIAVLPSQALMAIGAERAVELWHLNEMTQFAEFGVDEGGIASMALSADGERLIAGRTLGYLRVWDLTSREVIADLEVGESGIDKVTLSANAMYAAAVSGGRVVVWNIAEKRPAFDFKAKAFITSVEFSPDGSLLATGELQSNRVTLHRVPSGELVDILLGHVQGVGGASFSPDGKTLATGSHDRKVKLWNLATGQEVATLEVESGVAAVRFSPDGRTLGASYYSDRGIFTRVWRAPSFEDVER